jgi:hypothetical protein
LGRSATQVSGRAYESGLRNTGSLLNPDFARKILGWQHSGFSIESGTRILDQPTRVALCQYLVRRSSRSFSRGRGTWKDRPALRSRAPASWYGRTASAESALSGVASDHEVDALNRRRTRARLLPKVHAIDVLAGPCCGSRTSIIAVITNPARIRRATGAALGIIACLDRHGRDPPPVG